MRVINKLVLSEASLTDRPAQEPALISIIKKEEDKVEVEKKVVYKSLSGAEFTEDMPESIIKAAKDTDELLKKAETVIKAANELLEKTQIEALLPDLAHLPGSDADKFSLLKAVRNDAGIMAILKAHNDTFKGLDKTTGTEKSKPVVTLPALEQLEQLAVAHKAANGGTYEQAFATVIMTTAGRNLYKETTPENKEIE